MARETQERTAVKCGKARASSSCGGALEDCVKNRACADFVFLRNEQVLAGWSGGKSPATNCLGDQSIAKLLRERNYFAGPDFYRGVQLFKSVLEMRKCCFGIDGVIFVRGFDGQQIR